MDQDEKDKDYGTTQDATAKKVDQLREAVLAQVLRAQNTVAANLRKQSMLKDSFAFTAHGDMGKESSPSPLSPRSSPRSSDSSHKLTQPMSSTTSPSDFPFPVAESVDSGSSDVTAPPTFARARSSLSDITVRFRPSISQTTPTPGRRPTYNTWSGSRDFPSPNIYDLTLKMNADIGLDSFWENIIEIFVTNFYASRVSLTIPYDLTDINNTPWGLKATYNGSVDKQQTRIKLERRQSEELNRAIGDSGSISDSSSDSNLDNRTPTEALSRTAARTVRQETLKEEKSKQLEASIERKLDEMLSSDHKGKVYANLKPLNMETDPLIDNSGIQRVLNRGSIIVLSRDYGDTEEDKQREDEALKRQEAEKHSSKDTVKRQGYSRRNEVLAAWGQTYFKARDQERMSSYEEYEQPLTSPWSYSPAPSPAILKESAESPFFDNDQIVESAFSPSEETDYTSTDVIYAIGMENSRSVVHIPLIHPHTSKTISMEGEGNFTADRPRIVPIAIISFVSAVVPYPPHLITSLSTFAPLIATSLSQAIRHSNVVHQLTHSPLDSPSLHRSRVTDHVSPNDTRHTSRSPETGSDRSVSPWDFHGSLFSPAVAEAETPSPFRSSLGGETDYFSIRGQNPLRSLMRSASSQRAEEREPLVQDSSSDGARPGSGSTVSSSKDTAPTTDQSKSSSSKPLAPIKVRKRNRRLARMIPSHGAIIQINNTSRPTPPRKPKTRVSDGFSNSPNPSHMSTPSSRLLKVVVDSIPVHVFTAEPDTGTISWANARTLAYRGVSAGDYIANPHASIHPDDREEFIKRWNRMLKQETEGISHSIRIRRFDGLYRWFIVRVVPLRDSRGSVVHWFGTSMDIHDSREAEINTARQEEIKASEIKYRSLAEASPQIVFAATPSLGISYANSQWMTYSGVTYEETAKLGFLSFVHPEDRDRCALPVNGGEPQFSVEIRLKAADDTYRWHLVKCIRIEDRGNSKDDVWLGTCTDIHDHKLLEERLKQSNEAAKAAEAEHKKRAEDALETRRQQEFFIDMVSHELRNPLSAIVQSSDVVLTSLRRILLQENLSPARVQQVSDDIETMKSIVLCTMHMRRLIDDTINVSKLESGMLQVTPVDCQPMTIVRQIQQIFDAELQSKKIEMEILQDRSLNDLGIDWVRADPSRISQILINLLSNAIKFLDHRPERRITLTLAASTQAPKSDAIALPSPSMETEVGPTSPYVYLFFSIMDTGPGLNQDEISALFKRFSQATPRTHVTYGGSGLGLFISKRLVELQGGRIYVDSEEGAGSTFSFFIKVERSDKVTTSLGSPLLPASEERILVEHKDGQQTHVLVVEDNIINQRLLKKQLIGAGYRVSVANHGQEAIDKILASQNDAKESIHIVLMDVEMPILDGLQATKVLREAEKRGELRKHIPVIAVSANAREEQKKKMFDAGADSYLTKPFQLPELVAKLKEQEK